MPELFNLQDLKAELTTALAALMHTYVELWALAQVALAALDYGLAVWLVALSRPWIDRLLLQVEKRARLVALVQCARTLLVPFAFLVLLWLTIGVMRQVTWPSRSYLLGVLASLMTAWIVIRLSSTLIANPKLARGFALVAWAIAALDITGTLGPVVTAMDGIAIQLGSLRVSALGLTKGVILFAGLVWLANATAGALERRIRDWSPLSASGQVLLTKMVRIALLGLAFVIALDSIGIDLTAVAFFSGAIGLGIGFGLQKVVSNLISGIILLLDKSIKPGDVIEVGQTFGWINSMSTRYVSVVTRDGKEYLIPNEDLITQRVVNWSFSSNLVRIEVEFGTAYKSDPHLIRRLVVEAAKRPQRVLAEPEPICHLAGFGESSLDFLLRFWIGDPHNGVANVKGQVLLAIWDCFREHGIEIPYPHREVIVREPIPVGAPPAAAGH